MRVEAAKSGGATSKGMTASVTPDASQTDRNGIPPYVSTEQLTALTPWTTDAIEKKITRGMLVRNVHFFQPAGRRSQRIFKWAKIIELIEGRTDTAGSGSVVHGIHANGRVALKIRRTIDVEKATTNLQRLLG